MSDERNYQRIGSFELFLDYRYDNAREVDTWELERDFLLSILLGQELFDAFGKNGFNMDDFSDIRIV